ncbi:MAG: MFS transporter [Candidatus Sungbacteria bacterium]|nr:MFS transporter [Candidatus Sungbacteria bacterium]
MKFTISFPNLPKFSFPKINQVVLIIIFAHFIFTTAAGLTTPLFAIFVLQNIGQPVTAVGFAIALYWICKSVLQLPVARYLDRTDGECDDHYAMLAGTLILVVATFLYYLATEIWHVYLLQIMIAVGDSLIVPPFYAIFSRHLDREHTGFEWALFSSFSIGAGSAIGGIFSGILASVVGIRAIFLVNGTLSLIALVILWFLKPYISPRVGPGTSGAIFEPKRP